MISEAYITQLLQKFAASTAGKKVIQKHIPNYSNPMANLSKELRNDIVEAYNQTTSVNARLMGVSKIYVGVPKIDKSTGSWVVDISFPDSLLSRDSLTGWRGSPTGRGVYDIFGLFTQGYPRIKRVYGVWEGRNNGKPISNKISRPPNSFISDTISSFEASHPGIKIDYPYLWGGMGTGIL